MTAVAGQEEDGAARPRIAATVVTGFLGAGKTTLVNHILANEVGLRVAVIVNEFGAIGIDGDLVAAAESDLVELSNGCICCSLNGDLVASIERLRSRAGRIDHLLVETTGLADPLPVALTLVRPEFRALFRLDSILTVVDAENFGPSLFDSPAALNQLRYGDVVLLNKADLVTAERANAIAAEIRGLGSAAAVLPVVRAAAPLALILGVERRADAAAGGPPLDLPNPSPGDHHHDGHAHPHGDHAGSPRLPGGDGPAEADPRANHIEADGFSSLSFESARPFAAEALQAFLERAGGAGVYRGKGILWVDGTEEELVFHLVGRRFSLDARPSAGPSGNRLVLIGRGLDAEALRHDLAACLVDGGRG